LRGIIACILMLAVWVSFHPFTADLGDTTGGNIINQLGFGLLFILCMITLVTLVERQLLARLVTPSWLVLGLVLVFAVIASSSINASFRAMVFSIIVILAAITVMTLPRNIRQFALIIATGCLLSLAFSYFAIFVFPASGVHPYGGVESQHGGLWRGIYDHKNIAGAVMAVFAMIGVFTWREGYRLLGIIVTILALVFLFNAESKTSGILLPVAMLNAAFVARLKTPLLRFVITLVPLVILFTITVGSAVMPQINGILQMIAPGTTFTGRLDLWQYTVERIAEHPFAGYGFENFWGTPIVTAADQPIELTWDVREIVHGHNSYLDAAIAFGLPGIVVVMYVLIILPAMDFAATNWQGPSQRLANLFLSIWIFTSLNACLESFFFRRADPVWFCMLLAVLGLRLLASGRTKHSKKQIIP
jgi:O-antigen ligase